MNKVKQGSLKLKSPEYQTRKSEETVTGAKRASPNLKQKLPGNAEELCNEENISILWPILGVNSKGEKGRDPRCPSSKRCVICSSRCPEDNEKPQCKACLDPLHRRGCDAREICETARWNTIRKKKEAIRSSGISSLKELKEKKLVTMSPYPPSRGSSQPPGGKRTRDSAEEEEDNNIETSLRARSISRSSLPRKTLQSYFSTEKTSSSTTEMSRRTGSNEGLYEKGRKESEPDMVSGSGP